MQQLKHNHINLSQLCDYNKEVRLKKSTGIIYDLKGKPILLSRKERDVYLIDLNSAKEDVETCLYTQSSLEIN